MIAAWFTVGAVAAVLAWIEIRRALKPGSAVRQILGAMTDDE